MQIYLLPDFWLYSYGIKNSPRLSKLVICALESFTTGNKIFHIICHIQSPVNLAHIFSTALSLPISEYCKHLNISFEELTCNSTKFKLTVKLKLNT